MTAPGEPVDNLASLIALYLQQTQGGGCMDNSYDDFIKMISNTTADRSAQGVGIRQWTWQTAVQFGYYQTCEEGTACPLSKFMTLLSNTQINQQVFGISAAVNGDRVAFTNDYYGAKNISATRICFANGSIDPWHALSAVNSTDAAAMPSVFIDGTAHCANMMPSSPNDPPALVQGRKMIAANLADFLAQN
jgi:serine protease 16